RDTPARAGFLAAPGFHDRLRPRRAIGRSFDRRDLLDLEAFQGIANFHIVEIRDARAALETGAHFVGVFLESPQGTDSARVDHHVVAEHANVRIPLQDAFLHGASCDHAHALYAEGVANFSAAEIGFLDERRQQPGDSFLKLVYQLVDNRV